LSLGCKRSRGSPGVVRRHAVAGAAALAGLTWAAPALAAEASRSFTIPAQPLQDALVAFGLQAGVSVGAGDLARCAPSSQAVVGRYTPRAALARLLSGTRCDFDAVDERAFSVAPRQAPPARAQQARRTQTPAAEVSPVVLDLTVTTTRRPSLVGRTPASVGLAQGASLVTGRITSLQELAADFAGVTVTNLGPGRNKIFVRGLSDGAFTGRTQSTVGLYLDDVPITYNAPDPDLRLVDVARVELMRGPQGTLYGVGSMGGIVRIVTRKPALSDFAMGAAAGVAATESGEPSRSLDVMVNAPILPGRLAFRGVVYSDLAGGYVDDSTLGVKDANRTLREGGRAALTAVVTPDWEVTVGGTAQRLKSSDSQYVEGGAGQLTRDVRLLAPHHNDFRQGYATLDGSTEFGHVRISGAYLAHDFDTRYDASSSRVLFDSTANMRTFDQIDRVRLAVAEATISSDSGERLQWLAGVFGSRTREDLSLDLEEMDDAGRRPLYVELRHDRLAEAAVYGEATYALTPKLSVTAGARAFKAWLETDSLRAERGDALTFAGSLEKSGVSPKLVLSWQATPSKLIYAQAAQGYRTPGFNTTGRLAQQFNASATGNQPNRRYSADQLWSYEIGAKAAFDERRVELRTALFYNDWLEVQSDQFQPSGLPYTANVGRGVNIGLEGEATFRYDRALTLRANFLVNSPELRKRDPTYPSRPGASLPAVPRYSAAVTADWSKEVSPGLTAELYGRVAYVGSSILTFQEQADSQMGNYFAARLAASLQSGRWRATLFVENPTNAEGDTFAFGDPFTQGRSQQSTPLRPRTVGLTLAYGL